MIYPAKDDRPLSSSGSGGTAKTSTQYKAGRNQPAPVSTTKRRFLWAFSIVMVVTAGTAFLFKLIEFFWQFSENRAEVSGEKALRGAFWFSVEPLIIYLVVAAGFGCLFFWAYLTGQFRDVERPKYRMLEMQQAFDQSEITQH